MAFEKTSALSHVRHRLGALAALAIALAGGPAFAQGTAGPEGDWRGALPANAISLRLAFHLGATSTFDSLDQGATGIPVQWSAEGRRVTIRIAPVATFEGELSPDGNTLTGQFKQGGVSLPLTLERGRYSAARRPQTPVGPFPYSSVEARYANPAKANVRLAGTLTVPQGKGPFPAALLITGSGAQDRDETIFDHKPFAVLADDLTRRGIAVLRVDDRGTGGSTGAGATDTTRDFATDVEAGVAWLKSRGDIDPARIGLIGHSEGGIIAPIVAAHNPSIAFVILWAGPGVNGKEIVVEQVRALALSRGASSSQAEITARAQRAVLDAIVGAPDAASARSAAQAAAVVAGIGRLSEVDLGQMTSAWYRSFLIEDPTAALGTLRTPVLALLGGKDVQVVASQNEPALKRALAGNPRAEVRVLPGLNHLFQTAMTGAPSEYGTIEETVAPMALTTIGDWLAKTVGAARR